MIDIISVSAAVMMGGSNPVIKPLTITENGTYTAPSGIDGYSPVSVGVPDRYDEGYKDGYDDGYSDAEDKYEKLIEQINGDGETVEDDDGNVIENAIVSDDTDELSDLLEGVVFPSDGGEVTVQGLSGADCSFTVECNTEEKNTTSGTSYTVTTPVLTVTNLSTGETFSATIGNTYAPMPPDTMTFRVSDVAISSTQATVSIQWYKNGEPYTSAKQMVTAAVVGGTSFGTSDTQWAMTQQQY